MAVEKIPIWHKAVLTSEEAAEYGNLALVQIKAHAVLAKHGKSDFPCFFSKKYAMINVVLINNLFFISNILIFY